jgi:hypothetical protein
MEDTTGAGAPVGWRFVDCKPYGSVGMGTRGASLSSWEPKAEVVVSGPRQAAP